MAPLNGPQIHKNGGFHNHVACRQSQIWSASRGGCRIGVEYGPTQADNPVFTSPYLPEVLCQMTKLETSLYHSRELFGIQEVCKRGAAALYPFRYLGQRHLFLCVKGSVDKRCK